MPIFGRHYLAAVVAATESPAISIYMGTHRKHPENAQDPIRFKNLVKQVEEALNRSYTVREVRPLLEPLHQLHDDKEFWNHTLDGLAVLASASRFDVFEVPRSVPELAIVADTFHVKPLLRYLQSADRFHVLALAEDRFAVYEGYRYALDPIRTPKVSTRAPAPSDPKAENVVGEGIAGYYRAVDHAVTEGVSKPANVPMVLVGLSDNLAAFRAVAKNPHLLSETVSVDPFAIGIDDLRARVWSVLEPHLLARLAKLSDEFGSASSHWKGTSDLSDAARAAVAGRVGTLLVDADRVQPGTIDSNTGEIQSNELADPLVDDQLDELAELVLKTGGEVIVVPTERMPTKTGLAATFRF